MLKFKLIRYKNLMAVGNDGMEFRLDNAKSNLFAGAMGSSKSSFIEALAFGLYGKPYRPINKPQLVNSQNKADLLVEIEFATGGHEYKVRRGIKPTIFEIYKDDKLIDQDASSYDYQDILEKNILHMNFSAFIRTVVLGKANYTPFMALKPGPRRDFIDELLDMQPLVIMSELHKKNVNENKEKQDSLKTKIDNTNDKLQFVRDSLTQILRSTETQIKAKQEQLEGYTKNIYDAIKEAKNVAVNLEDVKSVYDKTRTVNEDNLSRTNQLKQRISDKVKTVDKEINFFEHSTTCSTCSQNIEDGYREQMIQQRKSTLEDLSAALEQVDKKIEVLLAAIKVNDDQRKKINELQSKLGELKTTVKLTKNTISDIQHDIEDLENQTKPSKVNADHIKNFEDKLKEYKKSQDTLKEDVKLYRVASHLLKDSGIKSNLIKQYIPVINNSIAYYLSMMNLDIGFKLDENFTETVSSPNKDSFSYFSFSEGEKARIDFAMLMAWREVAKKRNSCNCNLLVLDEVLDGSLDAIGIDNVLSIISDMVGQGNSVFVISHNENIAGAFDVSYKFEKIKDFGRVTEQ